MLVLSLSGFEAQAPRVLRTRNKKRWMHFPREASNFDTEGQVGCRWPDMRKNKANDGDKKIVCIYHRAVHVFFVIRAFIHSHIYPSFHLSIFSPSFLPSIHLSITHPFIHPPIWLISHLSSISPSQSLLQNFFTLQVQHFLYSFTDFYFFLRT